MGRALDIIKVKEEDGVYYYVVADYQPERTKFIIAIDAEKKTVSYFLTVECKNPITVIDFNVSGGIKSVPPFDEGTAESAFLSAGVQAYRAILSNHFPEHIGRYS